MSARSRPYDLPCAARPRSAAVLAAALLLGGCGTVGMSYQQNFGSVPVQTIPTGPCCEVSGRVATEGAIAAIVAALLLADGLHQALVYPQGRQDPERAPFWSRPEADPARRVSEQDCTQPLAADGGNLKCR